MHLQSNIHSGKSYGEARHWANDEVLRGRGYFGKKEGENANLVIEDVQESDNGIYECRVDFKHQATSISSFSITVVGKNKGDS